jgi:23S rRNA pseudouridine2605 synthase
MARNSRFRSTTGPTSGRPRPDKKKSWDKKKDGDSPSFRGKKSYPSGGEGERRPPRSAGGGRFAKPEGFRKRFSDEGKPGSDDRRGPRENKRGGSFGGKKPGFSAAKPGTFRTRFSDEGKPGQDDRKGFGAKRSGGAFGAKRPGFSSSKPGTFRKRTGDEGRPGQDDRTGFQKKRFERGESKGERGGRPFYKQGFGRKEDPKVDRGEKKFKSRSYEDSPRGERPEGKERKSFVESRIERQRKFSKPSVHQESAGPNPDGLIRLNKFISNSGVCSRREADDLISMGLITVNGKSITELGYKVKPTDDVRYEGRRLKAEPMVYILLNKPKGYITTTDDPQERNTVMQLVEGACKERVYPVGRLDRNTSGLLLLTNDGELTDKLTHPSYNVKKIYKADLDKPLTKTDFQKIRAGVELEEGTAMVDDLAVVSEDGKTIGIEIHIGWNRVIRRIFEVLGYEVVRLDRSVYATLDKKDLPRGHWRFLRQDEVIRLKHFQ